MIIELIDPQNYNDCALAVDRIHAYSFNATVVDTFTLETDASPAVIDSILTSMGIVFAEVEEYTTLEQEQFGSHPLPWETNSHA